MFKDVLDARNFMGEETPLVIDVVDNGGQWTHREWRMLKYLKVDTQIITNDTPVDQLRELDGLILSGGAARIGLSGELGNCAEFLKLDIPILGICAGHQFMARFYGGDARESPIPEFGAMEIQQIQYQIFLQEIIIVSLQIKTGNNALIVLVLQSPNHQLYL